MFKMNYAKVQHGSQRNVHIMEYENLLININRATGIVFISFAATTTKYTSTTIIAAETISKMNTGKIIAVVLFGTAALGAFCRINRIAYIITAVRHINR